MILNIFNKSFKEKIFTYTILLSFSLLILSCSKSPQNDNSNLEIHINVGNYWIEVAHKNIGVEQNEPTDWFEWDWELEPIDKFSGKINWKGDWVKWDDAKTACTNYRGINNSSGWRLPTKSELIAISGSNGSYHNSNIDRKLKFEIDRRWKLYDERAGKESKFTYFQLSGSTIDWLDYFNEGGYYWTSDINEDISTNAWYLVLEADGNSEIFSGCKSDLGLSVRCVKNTQLHK